MGDALHLLRTVFGYHAFRGEQAAVIDHVRAGGDAVVIMPTGGGKSLCYQIPALLRPGVGIVVSPLIALMHDQVTALRDMGVRAACLNSSIPWDEQRRIMDAMQQGEIDLVYVAPERLVTPECLQLLQRTRIAVIAIDEVHCVSQWGHDFRPEYLQLGQLQQRFPEVPRIALTATADDATRHDIVTRLHMQRARQFVASFDRPNITYTVTPKQNAHAQLETFLQAQHQGDAGIVYCFSRAKVEATATWLTSRGIRAYPYHAGLSPTVRQRHQDIFLREEGVIMVATIAFGMGINKPNVRFVAHLDLPKSVEAYYQETGRAGRDGLAANAWMLYGLADVVALRQLMATSDADATHKQVTQHKLQRMLGYCESTKCRRHQLLDYFGEVAPDQCTGCDNCLSPAPTWDATVAAQKALSCIYRTGQRFGVGHLVDVLLGKSTERVEQFRHDQLSTFGIGGEHSAAEWQSIFRQLIAHGWITVDPANHGGLSLPAASRAILQGTQPIQLRHLPEKISKRSKRSRSSTASDAHTDSHPLWDSLRALRLSLARERGVPPYVIFHDATLRDMLTQQPRTLDAMAQISGVGAKKLEQYGTAFLECLAGNGTSLDN